MVAVMRRAAYLCQFTRGKVDEFDGFMRHRQKSAGCVVPRKRYLRTFGNSPAQDAHTGYQQELSRLISTIGCTFGVGCGVRLVPAPATQVYAVYIIM